jgi:hypothetical protein
LPYSAALIAHMIFACSYTTHGILSPIAFITAAALLGKWLCFILFQPRFSARTSRFESALF